MHRIVSFAVAVLLAPIAAGSVSAQPCNLSGTWSGLPPLTLRDDGNGNLTGVVPGSPATATLVTGTRTGSDVTIAFSASLTLVGTLTGCDSIGFTAPISGTITRTSQSYCGDGVIDANEECDDGNFVNGDVCTRVCTSPACGNGVPETDEECDDGNGTNGDGCSSTCEVNVCGNTIPEPGEECDDGNLANGDGCSSTCQVNVCGNGDIESGEQCDDGNTVPDDTCSDACQFLGCDVTGTWDAGFNVKFTMREGPGGTIDGLYFASGGLPSGAVAFSATRSGTAVTGLGIAGNATQTSCTRMSVGGPTPIGEMSRVSTTYCGDGAPQGAEECDDGNLANGDGCTAICTLPACLNGVVEAAEECDDANGTNGDGCSTTCEVNVCGNTIPEPGEECDDGNLTNGDGCSSLCQVNVCGNSVIESGETCDDGNTVDGDACTSLCQFVGCNMTGQWFLSFTGSFIADLVEAPDGTITGITYAVGATSGMPVTGTRIGTALTFSGILGNATLTSCDAFMLGSLGLTFGRLTGPRCGDGDVGAGEQCDDGNLLNGDACPSTCLFPNCGNGVTDPSEECDDGNAVDEDACLTGCRLNVCGDGITRTGVEQCDAGSANSADPDALCRPSCQLPRCADGVVDTGRGEQCDDGNVAIADGCDGNCLTETVVVETVSAGGSVTTDPGGTGATPEAPVQTAVTSPNPGPVTLVVTSVVPTSQPGYQLLGRQVNIIAPPATAADPLRFVFEFDAGEIPPDQDETTLVMFRNGVLVAECPGSTTALATGPCITARERLVDGDVRLTVLTAAASSWTVGIRGAQALAGNKLLLKSGPVAAKKALVVQSKDPGISLGSGNGSADDPVLHGATVRVQTTEGCAGPCDATYTLPASGWAYVGKPGANVGYKYKDVTLANGPIKAALVKGGKLAKLSGKGAGLGHELAAAPDPVTVSMQVGATRSCMAFGGTTKFVAGRSFSAKNAPAGTCP